MSKSRRFIITLLATLAGIVGFALLLSRLPRAIAFEQTVAANRFRGAATELGEYTCNALVHPERLHMVSSEGPLS